MELRAYLNLLPSDRQIVFAERIGTSLGYLRKAISIGQGFGADLALAIERETGGAVTVAELRPAFAESLKAAGYIKVESPGLHGPAAVDAETPPKPEEKRAA